MKKQGEKTGKQKSEKREAAKHILYCLLCPYLSFCATECDGFAGGELRFRRD
jgi:hypothetical protein